MKLNLICLFSVLLNCCAGETVESVNKTNNCQEPTFLCKPSGIEECQGKCADTENCNFTTFTIFRNTATCYLLRDCQDKICSSAPKSCNEGALTKKCPKLTSNSVAGSNARWTCDGVNPYQEEVPSGTVCQTSCPSWRNSDGLHVSASSHCQEDGTWAEPQPAPPGDLLYPPVLPAPDKDDLSCQCSPLNLTYNPNDEPGAEFYCTTDVDWDLLPVQLSGDTQCFLLCSNLLTASFYCMAGLWAGHPDTGVWCSRRRDPLTIWRPQRGQADNLALESDIFGNDDEIINEAEKILTEEKDLTSNDDKKASPPDSDFPQDESPKLEETKEHSGKKKDKKL